MSSGSTDQDRGRTAESGSRWNADAEEGRHLYHRIPTSTQSEQQLRVKSDVRQVWIRDEQDFGCGESGKELVGAVYVDVVGSDPGVGAIGRSREVRRVIGRFDQEWAWQRQAQGR